jgi:hypothetical protein
VDDEEGRRVGKLSDARKRAGEWALSDGRHAATADISDGDAVAKTGDSGC